MTPADIGRRFVAVARGEWGPVVAAGLVAGWGLGAWSLWEDELFTWNLATQLPLERALHLIGMDRHPPGYFLAMWALGRVGESDAWVRLPSAVASVGAVAVVGRLGRRLGAGNAPAWLLALLPFFAVYASMARSYAGMLLVGAGLLAASLAPMRRGAVAVGALGAVGLYLHYAMAAPVVAAVGALAARGWAERGARGLGAAAGAAVGVALAFLPWIALRGGSQVRGESSQALDVWILRYLFWPVGSYVPYAAALLLVLAGLGAAHLLRSRADRGEGWALATWIGAALLLPLAASTRSATAQKLYVFAPLLPLFVLLAGAGLRRGIEAARPWLGARAPALALVLAAPMAVDLGAVARLHAQPLEAIVDHSGSRDVRHDVAVLARVAPNLLPNTIDDRPFTPYQRYFPTSAQPTPPMREWFGWRREAGAEAAAIAQGARNGRCFFRVAFVSLVYVRSFERCEALRAAVLEAAERDGYGPFLLQAAVHAYETGDAARAERLAERAVGRMGPSMEPERFLARRRAEAGDFEGARAWLEAGLTRARVWGARARYAELALEAAQRSTDAESGWRRVACAQSDAPLWVCETPAAGLFAATPGR